MIYFDTPYVVRCYLDEPGASEVRALGSSSQIACVQWGQAEVTAAFHRKLREGVLTPEQFDIVTGQFGVDIAAGIFTWLPLHETYLSEIRESLCHLAFDSVPPGG
jgi:hypothetical protein